MSKNKMYITKEYTFEAAHVLELDDFDYGKCGKQYSIAHGHSYLMNVSLFIDKPARDLARNGMIMNFVNLDKIVKELFIDPLDHKMLNEAIPEIMSKDEVLNRRYFMGVPNITTCEIMSYIMAIILAKRIKQEMEIEEIKQNEIGKISKVGIELWEGRKGRCYYEFNISDMLTESWRGN